MTNRIELDQIDSEMRDAAARDPYSAVSDLWVCLVKYANSRPSVGGEFEQISSLVRGLDRNTALEIVSSRPFLALCDLQPPLETVLTHSREQLKPLQAGRELERMRRGSTDPRAALAALLGVLNRVRDKRMHGFKTPGGPRDEEILGASSALLQRLCQACSELLRSAAEAAARTRPALG